MTEESAQLDATSANFVTNVRAAREARGWSQGQLADELVRLGVHATQSSVSRLEKGEREPKLSELKALATAFSTTADAMWRTPEQFQRTLEWNEVLGAFTGSQTSLRLSMRDYEAARRALREYLERPFDSRVRVHSAVREQLLSQADQSSCDLAWEIYQQRHPETDEIPPF